ncbi:hypothetical protein FJ444_05815 [Aestuariibacter sp. GS-14]|uniref:hypothetical protein n=1 Tax=Aestuariibacter sp. GS-14 TaxID=2590670 RepID=UPI0011286ED7|nr:hypothetical protein [Aestuariibacter sp. GS-14]TPV61127.1 hypothetical protein FJ444_05815 [Aestuariibacter sp. GS-14]
MRFLNLILLSISISVFANEDGWVQYLNRPSAENAKAIRQAPKSFNFNDVYDVLSVQVLSGDLEALNLALRLKQWVSLSASDSESLSVLIGKTARSFPEQYLKVVSSIETPMQCVGLVNYGLEYIDNVSAMLYENEQRQLALQSVDSSKLSGIRDNCLKILKADAIFLTKQLGN